MRKSARRTTTEEPPARKSWLIAYGPTVGAILAAAAAIATAVITSNSNEADTQRRIDHEIEVAHQDATGAARVLASELATAEVYMQGMLKVGRLIPYADKYDVQMSQDDLKQIATEIGVDNWQRVGAALSNLDSLGPYIRDEYRRGQRQLHEGHTTVFQMQIKAIDNAWAALDPLSGTPQLRGDPFGAE